MKRTWLIPAIILVFVLCCLGLLVFGAAGGLIYFLRAGPGEIGESPAFSSPTSTPRVVRPTTQATSQPGGQQTQITVSDETLRALENTIVPINDLADLARRLEGKDDIPQTVSSSGTALSVGEQDSFWVTNVDTNENFRISATLRNVSQHVYFWVQDEVPFDQEEVNKLVDTFENQIYSTNRDFFGSEWTPGVDGDPHLYILYAGGLGDSLAGYFSSADEFHPLAHEYSNAHEMFLLNADNVDLSSQYTYGVLAHEFQHMIHWYRDRNEQTWLNEGFSELASFLNGYDGGGFDLAYVRDPDIQLTDWPTNPGETPSHYGSAFLFLTYFLDRFGDQATQSLVGHPENGMVSIDEVLAELGARDPVQNTPITANDVFMDWVLTSFLNNESVEDGRYFYHNYPEAPQPDFTETVRQCPQDGITRDVHQYGVDYIRISCSGNFNLHFEGTIQVPVVPEDPFSGDYAFWSNRGDESDMTLTRAFDFTEHQGPLTLNYWTWYDLEEDYDYLYLEASSNGKDWQILTTPSGTAEDPSGNSYGWGYNGASRGWIQESVDLSQYAGQEVQVRFEYVTDAAVNGEGFLLDDVAIPEVDYFSDFEDGDGGWTSEGWVRIQNLLPQTYRLALISFGRDTTIEYLTPADDNTLNVPLQIGEDVDEVVLVVTGATSFTRQKAAYRYSLLP
jgi:immune inhibitor A